jgi:hypothetical protein
MHSSLLVQFPLPESCSRYCTIAPFLTFNIAVFRISEMITYILRLHCKDTLRCILFTHLLNFWRIARLIFMAINCNSVSCIFLFMICIQGVWNRIMILAWLFNMWSMFCYADLILCVLLLALLSLCFLYCTTVTPFISRCRMTVLGSMRCVCTRERERERESVCVCVCTYANVQQTIYTQVLQKAGKKSYENVNNKPFENTTKFTCLGITATKQNFTHK